LGSDRNFPGLRKLEAGRDEEGSFQTILRKSLLSVINSVEISGVEVSLTEFQLDVWRRLKSRAATAISAPTSAGKSFVVLEHLCEAALSAEKFTALYLAPTRALLNEVHAKIERRLKGFESTIGVTTIPLLDPTDRQKQIYVLTQERAQLLLSAVHVEGLFDLVIVDEAQAIGDDSRGMILQDVLERLRVANPSTRFLFLAPGAQGFEALHVHKQYSLAGLVKRGVAFHYGSMPSLLRESIEDVFRDGELNYLCCTTTLFQGVNLPARNVFIDTPTRGRGDPLDAAALWNFAGRAGRLGEEVVGNVFLVNYPNWDSQPLTVRRPFSMTVAFNDAVVEKYEEVIDLLSSAGSKESELTKRFSPSATAAAGLVLLRASQGTPFGTDSR
jgi:superfamily II RNA helicase